MYEKELTITYITEIEPSTGQVAIYQSNSGEFLLKQMVATNNTDHVKINGKEMKITVEHYTFNQGGTSYAIVIGNAAVKASVGQNLPGTGQNFPGAGQNFPDVEQNLLGVSRGAWKVTTGKYLVLNRH